MWDSNINYMCLHGKLVFTLVTFRFSQLVRIFRFTVLEKTRTRTNIK